MDSLKLISGRASVDGCRDESPVHDSGIDKENLTVLTQRIKALEKREARYARFFPDSSVSWLPILVNVVLSMGHRPEG